jgi:hypothetical protein
MYISSDLVAIFFGVVSGLVTAVLLWFFGLLVKKLILPWFQQMVYQGVDIGGDWIHKDMREGRTHDFEVALNVRQSAHRISGTFRATTKREGTEYTNYYSIKGTVKDNYVLFDYFAQRKDRTGIGSFLLRVSKGGTHLIGDALFIPDANIDDFKTATRSVNFVRN